MPNGLPQVRTTEWGDRDIGVEVLGLRALQPPCKRQISVVQRRRVTCVDRTRERPPDLGVNLSVNAALNRVTRRSRCRPAEVKATLSEYLPARRTERAPLACIRPLTEGGALPEGCPAAIRRSSLPAAAAGTPLALKPPLPSSELSRRVGGG